MLVWLNIEHTKHSEKPTLLLIIRLSENKLLSFDDFVYLVQEQKYATNSNSCTGPCIQCPVSNNGFLVVWFGLAMVC